MQIVPAVLMFLNAAVFTPSAQAESTITLEAVLAAVRENHPALKAARFETRTREAVQRFAAPYPNPELESELENVLGSGPYSGTDLAEITLLLGQPIPLGGKQAIRRRQAALDTKVAQWDEHLTERDVLTTATQAFYTALGAQQHVELGLDMVKFSEIFLEDTRRRVQAGNAPELESSKAAIALSESKIESAGARQQLQAAIGRLALICGKPFDSVAVLSGDLTGLPKPPRLEDLEAKLRSHPAWRVWEDVQARSQSDVDEADAERVPDIAVGAGVRYDSFEASHSFLFQAALPLPFWNRNEGARAAAREAARKTEAEAEAARRGLQLTLNEVYAEFSMAFTLAQALEHVLLPAAEEAHRLSREGYRSGRYGFLHVLEARSKLFEHRRRQIEVLTRCHLALADIAYLTHEPVPFISTTSPDQPE